MSHDSVELMVDAGLVKVIDTLRKGNLKDEDVKDDKLLVFEFDQGLKRFHPVLQEMSFSNEKAERPSAAIRNNHQSVCLDNTVYIFGGYGLSFLDIGLIDVIG